MKSPLLLGLLLLGVCVRATTPTWTADNGNGTFTNPLFFDEFSDPDLIRVGDDFYLTGTTMHAMPCLPILRSRDLVNWEFLGYALDRLDLGPAYRLEGGQSIYGQGIWAPSFRYRNGTFYLFANVNGQTTQLLRATNPAGPWTRTPMRRSLHDLSVLFDDDGKAYVVWGYRELQFAQLTDDLTDLVPGTERTLFTADAGMGEGSHFYKLNGKYFITGAWWSGRMRMPCARADRPEGPYEVNPAISADEDFGLGEGNRLGGFTPPLAVHPGNPASRGHLSLHQGGIVDTPAGEWWGFSMLDANSVGRLTCLSPVTWRDGWPYFGLPGNLGRTPRTWVKPNTGHTAPPAAPYARSDSFAGPKLGAVWQWNHVPEDSRWSLAERPGFLRLHSLPAPDFWSARNTLTQRAVGPESTATVELEPAGLHPGDVAGLAVLNLPYAWLGVRRGAAGLVLEQYDQLTGETARTPLPGAHLWLRVQCDFLAERASFAFSADGASFQPLGAAFPLVFQLKTFQGARFALFHFNTAGVPGGAADFARFAVDEPHPRGLRQPIPFGRRITLSAARGEAALAVVDGTPALAARSAAAPLLVVDRGLGRVALETGDGRFLAAPPLGSAGSLTLQAGPPADAETFQWMETLQGDVLLLSLATQRYVRFDAARRIPAADHPGPAPDRQDGSCLQFTVAD